MAHHTSSYEVIDVDVLNNIHFEISEVSSSYVPLHWHDAIEIISILEGELLVETERQNYLLHDGQCILLNAIDLHSTTSLHGNKSILVQIPLSYIEQYIPDIKTRQFIWNPLSKNERELTKIERIKEVLYQMMLLEDLKPDGYQLRFHSQLFELFYLLYHNFSSSVTLHLGKMQHTQRERIKQIFLYTESHYMEPITLDEIANALHLQVNYFCRFFKQQTGKTYLNYLNEYRLSKIYYDLLMTDLPLNKLLEIHGFTNYKLFRKMFQTRFGTTPGQLRKYAADEQLS